MKFSLRNYKLVTKSKNLIKEKKSKNSHEK